MSYGVQSNGGFFNEVIGQLQGRASATFVILAGIGLGLSSFKIQNQTVNIIVKRAIFLLILGLLNNADWSDIVMLSFITYLFFIDRNGKPEEK
jgi:hypothetical protein